ncbi:glycosyltransferase [Microbacterium sp. NPDC089320]|uniref:glycosyltransferase n=1 Tax=Microbacterium sp. NPDC089320 TaxID=3155182 RepID=UPI00343D0E3D
MSSSPRVSIIIPLFNDEEFVAAALQSCMAQTLADIEVICVDDASTDATVEIVENIRRRDARVRLVRQPENRSAFQARRIGIEAANAPYVLFLDGDDELAPHAASTALRKATSTKADVVGFGVDIVAADSRTPKRFEAALQPKFGELRAPHIVPTLFPVGEEANGHLWRYLFATSLLRGAYQNLDPHLSFYRANDLPITLLALAQAKKYVSLTERLYRYHFRRGTSGHAVDDVERFAFLLSGVEAISAIGGQIRRLAEETTDPQSLLGCYESARLHMIANVMRSCIRDTYGELQRTCLSMLEAHVGRLDVIRAAAGFCIEALELLSLTAPEPVDRPAKRRSVLLHTAHLDTGGLQSVLLEQAAALASAGHTVTIAVLRHTTRQLQLPPGVSVELVTGSAVSRIDRWLEICRDRGVDVVIDHHILYNENWAWHALAALTADIPTIGWIHNFALRPVFDASQRTSFLTRHLRLLWRVVTLSRADVAFWKLRGLEHVVYLPNPLSPLALQALETQSVRQHTSGRIELVWWGRLDGPTKQVLHLVDTARELKARDVDFRLKIIGPASNNLTPEEVRAAAIERGVDDLIDLVSELDAGNLTAELSNAHLLVSTSAIEGAPLTLVEAQALGIPIVMYDLPWLSAARGNDGMIRTPPGDPAALADAIAAVASSPERYEELSSASRSFARAAAAVDVDALTVAIVADHIPPEFSPEPTLDDARLLIDWLVRFAERNARDGAQGNPRELHSLRRTLDRTRRRLEQITRGPSYRVGRVVTHVPRQLAALLSAVKSRMSNTS